MKRKIIIVFLVLFLILITVYIKNQVIKNYSEKNNKNVLVNNLLNYVIQYPSPWRISDYLSKKYTIFNYNSYLLSEIGCDEVLSSFPTDEKDLEKDIECLKNHPKYNEFNIKLNSFSENWSRENSNIIILTSWSEEEEQIFISQVSKGDRSISDIDFDKEISKKVIQIYPSFSDGSFKEEKIGEASKIKRRFIYLQDNIKAYETDSKNLNEALPGALLVFVPHPIETKNFVGNTKGLIFKLVGGDKKSEENFYKILYSLKLNN